MQLSDIQSEFDLNQNLKISRSAPAEPQPHE
jgi:hypothetical protein